jgi:hypothetical protein
MSPGAIKSWNPQEPETIQIDVDRFRFEFLSIFDLWSGEASVLYLATPPSANHHRR